MRNPLRFFEKLCDGGIDLLRMRDRAHMAKLRKLDHRNLAKHRRQQGEVGSECEFSPEQKSALLAGAVTNVPVSGMAFPPHRNGEHDQAGQRNKDQCGVQHEQVYADVTFAGAEDTKFHGVFVGKIGEPK